jgi:hypothetical protein
MKAPFFPIQQFRALPLVLTASLSFALAAYAQQDTQQVEGRVNKILSQMTLDEKLSYISGTIVNFASLKGVFNIKPIPRLGLPEIFGNDGTIGILGQGFPPGTRYPFRSLTLRAFPRSGQARFSRRSLATRSLRFSLGVVSLSLEAQCASM